MAELSQTTAHAHTEGTHAGDAPRVTWARGKSQVLEKAHASCFISFITQGRGCSAAALTPEGLSLPCRPGKHFPARKLVFKLGQYYATSAHKQLPFPSPGAARTAARWIPGQPKARYRGLFALLQGCRASRAWCAARWGSWSLRGTRTTTAALFPQYPGLSAPASHPDTRTCCSAQSSRDAREALKTCR